MRYILSGDIGGTKTLLRLNAMPNDHAFMLQKSYASASYSGLADIVEAFLQEAGVRTIAAACFALAGPVNGMVVKLTNLPWVVDGDELTTRFSISNVTLINDFEAVGHGIAGLKAEDMLTLQNGEAQAEGVRLVVGAGTGLGVAWLSCNRGIYRVHPSEGGHIDFAPADELQNLLLRYLQHRHGHVSYERIVSGPGLLAIYEFMRDTGIAAPTPQLLNEMEKDDPAAVITRFSRQRGEEIARMTMDLFMSVYGAFVGNMALASLPRGGIYVAGGVAAKNAVQLQAGGFMDAFLSKGRFGELLSGLSLHVVLDLNAGLTGANVYAQQHV